VNYLTIFSSFLVLSRVCVCVCVCVCVYVYMCMSVRWCASLLVLRYHPTSRCLLLLSIVQPNLVPLTFISFFLFPSPPISCLHTLVIMLYSSKQNLPSVYPLPPLRPNKKLTVLLLRYFAYSPLFSSDFQSRFT
jgi:hypothetical protein